MTDKDMDMEDLDEYQLTLLAMKAFLHIRKTRDISDTQLLSDILQWFELMVSEWDIPEIEDVEYETQHDENGIKRGLH